MSLAAAAWTRKAPWLRLTILLLSITTPLVIASPASTATGEVGGAGRELNRELNQVGGLYSISKGAAELQQAYALELANAANTTGNEGAAEVASGGAALVMFHVPWCGHCKVAMEHFHAGGSMLARRSQRRGRLAKDAVLPLAASSDSPSPSGTSTGDGGGSDSDCIRAFAGSEGLYGSSGGVVLVVATVDCTLNNNAAFCAEHVPLGYPTTLLFTDLTDLTDGEESSNDSQTSTGGPVGGIPGEDKWPGRGEVVHARRMQGLQSEVCSRLLPPWLVLDSVQEVEGFWQRWEEGGDEERAVVLAVDVAGELAGAATAGQVQRLLAATAATGEAEEAGVRGEFLRFAQDVRASDEHAVLLIRDPHLCLQVWGRTEDCQPAAATAAPTSTSTTGHSSASQRQAGSMENSRLHVGLWKRPEQRPIIFPGSSSSGSGSGGGGDGGELGQWVASMGFEAVGVIRPDNYARYASRGLPFVWGFHAAGGGAGKKGEIVRLLEKVAKDLRAQFSFVKLDAARWMHYAIAHGLDHGVGIVVHDPASNLNYVFDKSKYTSLQNNDGAQALKAFLLAYLQGTLLPTPRSLPLDAAYEARVKAGALAGQVRKLVGRNFAQAVFDERVSVFVMVHAPWCGHCKALRPRLEQAASLLGEEENMVVAEIDHTANDIIPSIQVRGYPTLLLFPAGEEAAGGKGGIVYDGPRDAAQMAEFVR